MPLDDAVGINCKKVTTAENQGDGLMCVCWLIVCVLSDLKTTHP